MDKTVRSQLKKVVKEEIIKMLTEAKKKAPSIQEKLEEVREKLIPGTFAGDSLGENIAGHRRLERRVDLRMVSELIEVPVNELMLYFLNEIKNTNYRHLVEYRLGHVYFYAGAAPTA